MDPGVDWEAMLGAPGVAVCITVICILMVVLAYNNYYNQLQIAENAPNLPPLTDNPDEVTSTTERMLLRLMNSLQQQFLG